MNTQAILKLIDKKIDECQHGTGEDSLYQLAILHELKGEISSLKSIDIDSLQRYDSFEYKHGVKIDNGEYVRYDAIISLLNSHD